MYGPADATGPSLINASYLVTYNNNYPDLGYTVLENGRIPIERKELDTDSVVELDPVDNTIQFNRIGYYKISIRVNAYVPFDGDEFNPDTDFVSIGFRLVNTDNIYIGESQWITDETSKEVYAEGIITVENIANAYELVNLSKRDIYLNTPKLENINSNSYFVNAPVSIIIKYLGR